MTRQTSIETYNQIKQEGLLSKRRFIVYECLYHHGPMTQGECSNLLKNEILGRNGHQSITPRFAELKNRGVIQEIRTRPCTMTGRVCIEWGVTGSLPVKYDRKTKDQIIKELQEEVKRLQNELNRVQVY